MTSTALETGIRKVFILATTLKFTLVKKSKKVTGADLAGNSTIVKSPQHEIIDALIQQLVRVKRSEHIGIHELTTGAGHLKVEIGYQEQ